jgi:hypothetical protein
MTRKPKLNLLYVPATETPWLQLQVVVTPDKVTSTQHARRWLGTRFAESAMRELPPPAIHRKH